jgi:hypothetical protein
MMRLRDARTGRLHEFGGLGPGRVQVCGGGLRALLVADLVRRARTVLHDRAPVVTSIGPDVDGLADWNIHPPTVAGKTAETPDVVIGCRDESSCALDVGPLEIGALDLAADQDPLVLRLAALEFHYPDRARLDASRVRAAGATLAGWRAAVSAWATSPGAPMSMPHVHRLAAALDDDLATARALQVLRDLEHDESVSAGAKFETFAYADRLLGIDLARDVGR